ncbi:MAG: ABC transporter substrate-binding protein [Candidatus Dadabacteria bacterium]|nr:MAG: ABC transporter substrate-binding protein [Candidatus Dadabacteria bacterium]
MKTALRLILVTVFLATSIPVKALTQKDSSPVTIGLPLALSGMAAEWGSAELNAMRLALEECRQKLNEKCPAVKLAVEDTKSTSIGTVTAFHKLIDIDKAQILIGATWLDSYQGALPIATRKGVPVITTSASISALNKKGDNPLIFSTYQRADYQIEYLVKHLKRSGLKNLLMIFGEDPWWVAIEGYTIAAARSNSINITKVIHTAPAQDSFRSEILKIKQARPDAVIFGFNNDAETVNFLKQWKELRAHSKLYTTEYISGFYAKKDFRSLVIGVRYVAPVAADPLFHKKYMARYKKAPVFSAANAYDAMNITLSALQNGAIEAKKIGKFLKHSSFNTVSFGKVTFDKIGGVLGGRYKMMEIKEGGPLKLDL